MKIWDQNLKGNNSAIDNFLSGEDIVLDQELFIFDVEASIAHALELKEIKVLNATECKKIITS